MADFDHSTYTFCTGQADLLYNRGAYREALVYAKNAEILFSEETERSLEYARLALIMGSIYAELRGLRQAEIYFTKASKLFAAAGQYVNELRVLLNMANVKFYGKDFLYAEAFYVKVINEGVLKNSIELHIDAFVSYFYNLFDHILENREADLDMMATNLRAMKKGKRLNAGNAIIYYLIEAKIARSYDDEKSAMEFTRQAIAQVHELGAASYYILEANYMLADIYAESKKHKDAIRLLKELVPQGEREGDPLLLDIVFMLARLSWRAESFADVKTYYEDGINRLNTIVASLDSYDRLKFMSHYGAVFSAYIYFLFQREEYERALEITEMIQGRACSDAFFFNNTRRQEPDRSKLVDGRLQLCTPGYEEIRAEAKLANVHFLKFFLLHNDSILLCWMIFPDGKMECWDASESIEDIRAIVKENGLEYSFVVTKAATEEDPATVWQPEPQQRTGIESLGEAAYKIGGLSAKIFTQNIYEYLANNSGSISIMPGGILSQFPFSALLVNGDPIFMNWQISLIPGISLFLQLNRKNDLKTAKAEAMGIAVEELHQLRPEVIVFANSLPQRFIEEGSVGEPLFTTTPSMAKYVLHQYDFPGLPGVLAEACKLSKLLHAKVFCNEGSSLAAFEDHYVQADVVHIATHGFVNSSEPHMSFLLMGRHEEEQEGSGKALMLLARNVEHLQTNAELAVLSACNSSLGKATLDSKVGLVESFLISGSRNVLASTWPLDDLDTAFFMEFFYKKLVEGATVGSAFQQAQKHFHVRGKSNFLGLMLTGRPEYAVYKDGAPNIETTI
jgi:CHAT domain-containing protein/tetratricopeptide (TPR) repeat protein